MYEEGFKNTAEFHSYLISKNRRLQEYLNSLPMSLVDMAKSGKLRPPEEICVCPHEVYYMVVDKENERMNSIKSKIKPCLCGTVPSLKYERVGYYDDSLYFFIHCEKCSIKMEGTPHDPFLTNEEKMKFAEEIVGKWNAWIGRVDDAF